MSHSLLRKSAIYRVTSWPASPSEYTASGGQWPVFSSSLNLSRVPGPCTDVSVSAVPDKGKNETKCHGFGKWTEMGTETPSSAHGPEKWVQESSAPPSPSLFFFGPPMPCINQGQALTHRRKIDTTSSHLHHEKGWGRAARHYLGAHSHAERRASAPVFCLSPKHMHT